MISAEFLEGLGIENIKPAGVEIRGKCPIADVSPFHTGGDRRPSWSINTETGKSYCAACDKGWTLASLLETLVRDPKKAEALLAAAKVGDDAAKAARFLEGGAVKPYSMVKFAKGEPKHDRNLDVVFAQYWDARNETPYLVERGFKRSFLRRNSVGYDAQRRRVVVPIYEAGVLVGAVGRATRPEQNLRYFFYNKLRKGQYVYIPRHTRKPLRYLNTIFIVEGVLDALRLAQLGCPWVICVFGTKVTKRQAATIARLACETGFFVSLFMDDDKPGHRATGSLCGMLRGAVPGVMPRVVLYPQGIADPGELDPVVRIPIETVPYFEWLDTYAMLDAFVGR